MNATRKQLVERTAGLQPKLRAIFDRMPERADEPVPCPAEALGGLDAKQKRLYSMSLEQLHRQLGEEPPKNEQAFRFTVTSQSLTSLRHPDRYDPLFNVEAVEEAVTALEEAKLLAIVEQLDAKKAQTRATPDSFEAGSGLLQMYVFQMSDGQPVCQTPIFVESSAEVHYEKKTGLGSDDQKQVSGAISRDLQTRYRPTAQQALEAISGGVLQYR